MNRARAALVAAALMTAAVTLAAAAGVKVTPVVTDGRVLASFSAAESWTDAERELLQTGAYPVDFNYQVELRRPAFLLDPLLARTTVTASAKFDTLRGDYQVSRLRDGNVTAVERRDQEAAVRDWLTVFEKIELTPESPLRENADYYIQVRLYKSPRRNVSIWSILPGGRDDGSGRAEFTFLR